jgi:CheY-like chemotaxis protein
MMPVMSGEMTAQLLMRINPEVRIIACSGVAKASSCEELEAMGVNHVLTKPVTTSEILHTLHQVLTAKAAT